MCLQKAKQVGGFVLEIPITLPLPGVALRSFTSCDIQQVAQPKARTDSRTGNVGSPGMSRIRERLSANPYAAWTGPRFPRGCLETIAPPARRRQPPWWRGRCLPAGPTGRRPSCRTTPTPCPGGGGASGVLGVSPKLGLRMAHSFRDLPGLPNSWLQCSGQ